MEVFEKQIGAPSMISVRAAEDRIARFEAELFDARETPVEETHRPPKAARPSKAPASIDDFFALLERARITPHEPD
jgi:hypothetical protein